MPHLEEELVKRRREELRYDIFLKIIQEFGLHCGRCLAISPPSFFRLIFLTIHVFERVSDCFLVPSEQCFSYIIV